MLVITSILFIGSGEKIGRDRVLLIFFFSSRESFEPILTQSEKNLSVHEGDTKALKHMIQEKIFSDLKVCIKIGVLVTDGGKKDEQDSCGFPGPFFPLHN